MKKLVALLLAVMLLWSCMASSVAALAENVSASANELHFIVRHWHSRGDIDSTSFQGGKLDSSGDRYFVVVEGYIVPKACDAHDYCFFLVHQDGTGREEIHNSGYVEGSAYVTSLDHDHGVITLSTNQLYKDDGETEAEVFSSYSVSAGHDAVKPNNEERTLTITYDPNIHLVKAHAFYVKTTVDTENATQDELVFGDEGITKGDLEHDTTMVYTYTDKAVGHKKGEIVKIVQDGKSQPFVTFKMVDGRYEKDVDALKAIGISDPDMVEVTKAYDSSAGLHTDKTARLNASDTDGRTFDLDLEVWYSEGLPPQIGMVLDASGSMAFASDKPTPIKVEANIFDLLKDKIGTYDSNFKIDDLFMNSLVGYYEITNNAGSGAYANHRNWYLNSIKHTPSTTAYPNMEPKYFAKLVLQPEGNAFDFSEQKTLIQCGDGGYETWGKGPMNFSTQYGFNLTFAGYNGENSGFLLESASDLTSDDFTLSFTLKQSKYNPSDEDVEILYIGPKTGTRDGSTYFHVIRQDDDIVVSHVLDGTETTLFTLPTGFANNVQRVITFAFENGSVTAYMNGAEKGKADIPVLSHENMAIVFAPFQDKNNLPSDTAYFHVDNICLFSAALNGSEVNTMASLHTGTTIGTGVTIQQMQEIKGIDAFLTPSELALLLDPRDTDNSTQGWAGYSYFVYNPAENTMAYNPLAYYNNGANGATFGKNAKNEPVSDNLNGEGWYYVNGGGWEPLTESGTAKQLRGLSAGSYLDTIRHGPDYASLASTKGNGGTAPDVDEPAFDANTNHTYSNKTTGPVKFYIDANEYLRCFYRSGGENTMTSYVYKLEDKEYIRTEALQRALGLFVTELDERSPSARVSAVRFSAKEFNDKNQLNELVLLGWTDNPVDSTGMLSLGQGNDDETYYKYALTGGTYTWTGLQAYIDELMDDDNPYSDKSNPADEDIPPKYLILFTDGKDNALDTSEANKAKDRADLLKRAGYTIYTVLLDGGSMGAEDYEKAKEFLTSLSGNEPDVGDPARFYSTKKAKENGYTGNDADILTQMFVDDILIQIAHPLTDYMVWDYLDPRFDLVDRDGTVWHLNAGGKVVKGDGATAETIDVTKNTFGENGNDWATITLSDHSDDAAQTPYLLYEKDKDLYYLKWENQIIPGSAIGASSLPVWNARVTIRAKDDFIGGNAVLTNGTEKMMNFVQATKDLSPSSGTAQSKPGWNEKDDAVAVAIDDDGDDGDEDDNEVYLSKGFPRVSINITSPHDDVSLSQTIFMSEPLDKDDIAENLIEAAYDKSEGLERLYWEYIGRFVNYFNWLKDKEPGVIDTLHTMNRLGEYLGPTAGDSLETGHMKIISNRIYDMIHANELSIGKLSELLIKDDTVIDENGKVETEKYLYLPYIYLPDNPEAPTNSIGKDRHVQDVLGYLYFHVKDTDGVTYPPYPEADGGATKDAQTRMSKLTVSFAVRDPDVRGKWNNDQMIIDKDYERDTDAKPAVGVATNEKTPVIIEGTFTSYIVSGEIALQVEVSPSAATRLRQLHQTVTYTADLYWNDNQVGTFTAVIDPDKLTSNTVNATVTYNNFDGYQMDRFGMPKGTYTLRNEKGTNVPEGFGFGELELIGDSADYAARGLFSRGTSHDMAQLYLATISDNSFILGDENGADQSKPYTDYRFGLARVTLDEATPGRLTIAKRITGDAPTDTTDQKTYTFTVTGPDMVKGQTYPMEGGGTAAFDANGKATVTITGVNDTTIKNLPVGAYSVTEDRSSAEIADYALTTEGETSVTLTGGNSAWVTVTNSYTAIPKGSLTVSKTVGGTAGETDRAFFFEAVIGSETFSFTLKHGESWTSGMFTAGTPYSVTEADVSGDGYTTTITVAGVPAATAAGVIPANGVSAIVFTNTKNAEPPTPSPTATPTPSPTATPTPSPTATVEPTSVPTAIPEPQTGNLTVRKYVTGNAGDTQAEFTFIIMLSDTSLNGTYGDIAFTKGVATFALKHGESKTAAGLPAGIRYSVSEQSANQDGYATTATGETGIIAANATVTALFVNAKDVVDVPQTGDKSDPELWITLMLATLLSMAAFTFARRKGIGK